MKLITRPKGTRDIYPPLSLLYQKVYRLVEEVLTRNGFQLIILPTYEYTELFNTSLSSATDIIHKEMFNFSDRKGRKLALRPEGTISAARLVLQNRLFASGFPLKLYYWANMFRYERPQKGRYREFWQLGVELIAASGVWADYQMLKLVRDIFWSLGIKEFTCHLNYLGDKTTQERYKQQLERFLATTKPDLCPDCRRRSTTNPLRILDCGFCREKFAFPSYEMAWSEKDRNYLNQLNQILDDNNFSYQYSYHLVRGLDYYTGLVFEITLGQEKALVGGGRYDQLYQQLGGIDLPAVGFAIGIDRLLNYCEEEKLLPVGQKIDIFFLVFDFSDYPMVLTWKKKLENSFLIEYNLNLKTKPNFAKIIDYYHPQLLVLLEKEGKVLVKDLRQDQVKNFSVEKDKLIEWIYSYYKIQKRNGMESYEERKKEKKWNFQEIENLRSQFHEKVILDYGIINEKRRKEAISFVKRYWDKQSKNGKINERTIDEILWKGWENVFDNKEKKEIVEEKKLLIEKIDNAKLTR